ncbi:DUF3592 domain-containing protein [Kitasatospora xanthocidica]|uniref:DUF3592 domain-containing protein n=1 Tax=Kitasatospora xanthocidica TaxID=83382 RepID=A0A373A3H0_9ACTN|nr:DUF3592 domain-containing protein [Kitasatospora xanthocidica]RGD62294.1 DUF3592 domain-containing protein [Kitasatospora xanthocidica]
MNWHGVLALWCGAFGLVALVGYGRSLAGLTRAQRTVRVTGRIERVREPRHGSSQEDGIAVVVRFRDPSTGEEFVVTNDTGTGDLITTAWVGREVGIRYPPGRPHAFRFTNSPQDGGRGLGLPNSAVLLIYVGLVVVASIDWGWPWALVAVCGPLTVLTAFHLPGERRRMRKRLAELDAMASATGRVIAVLRTVETDADGDLRTSRTPVYSFTTPEGTAVTGYQPSYLSDTTAAYGQDVVIHYAPDNPADFTPALAATRGSVEANLGCAVLALVILAAAAVTGAVLLSR